MPDSPSVPEQTHTLTLHLAVSRLVGPRAQAAAALAVPALLAVSKLLPASLAQWAWAPQVLALVVAALAGLALPAPGWAAGKPAVQGPLVPVLATAATGLGVLAHSLPPGVLQLGAYLLALVASGLAGLVAPQPLVVQPVPAPATASQGLSSSSGCSAAEAAQGKCR